MTSGKRRTLRRLQGTLLVLICMSTLLLGCNNNNAGNNQKQDAAAKTEAPKESNTANENKNTAGQTAPKIESKLPEGVEVKKVIKEVKLKNNNTKKIERLSDGGERITITTPNGDILLQHLEYEGIIQSVNGTDVTVKVDHGGEKTITIPSNTYIDDEDALGLKKGVEIDWIANTEGYVESVELDD